MDRPPDGIDVTTPSVARVYDYIIGGKDNFEADRAAAHEATAAYPGGLNDVRAIGIANRDFLGQAVRYLAKDVGLRQFLDIGAGLPTADNVHQVAQRIAPESRVVYVDHDPSVLAHARTLLSSTPDGATYYVDADLRDPDLILREAAQQLDLSRPAGVLLIAILHVVDDADNPYGVVERLMEAMSPGSHLVVSHLTADIQTAAMNSYADTLTEKMNETVALRDQAGVSRFFDGLELVPPGVVTLDQWSAGADTPSGTGDIPAYCGIGRKLG